MAAVATVAEMTTDDINQFTRTIVCIPCTTNLRRAQLPSCLLPPTSEGGLAQDSVALCHQIRVLDRDRLSARLGLLSDPMLAEVERVVAFTRGMSRQQRER